MKVEVEPARGDPLQLLRPEVLHVDARKLPQRPQAVGSGRIAPHPVVVDQRQLHGVPH